MAQTHQSRPPKSAPKSAPKSTAKSAPKRRSLAARRPALTVFLILFACLLVALAIGLRMQRNAAPDFTVASRIQSEEVRHALDHISRSGHYTEHSKVAAYLYQYGTLPPNYRSKKEHMELTGDEAEEAWAIGGDHFGNYEGLLPAGEYREADVNMTPESRGPERLVYASDGAIYYTADHYENFELLVAGTKGGKADAQGS